MISRPLHTTTMELKVSSTQQADDKKIENPADLVRSLIPQELADKLAVAQRRLSPHVGRSSLVPSIA